MTRQLLPKAHRRSLLLFLLLLALIGVWWSQPERPDPDRQTIFGEAPQAAGSIPAEVPASRRKVLLLTVDTLRADHVAGQPLDGLGAEEAPAPFLHELGQRGYQFERALAPVPRTTPALASLLAGSYPHTTKVRSLVDPLSDNITPMAELFAQRGYQTVAVVSNHVLRPQRRLYRGFQIYDYSGDGRDAPGTNRSALGHLRQLDPEQPIFLWVHYIDPHMPYAPPGDLVDRFVDSGYEGPYRRRFGGEPGSTGPLAFPKELPKRQAIYRNPLPEAVNAHIRRLYAADVRGTDEAARELVSALEETWGEGWTIVFTADHGESLGEQKYFFEHGDYVYDSTVRVPLSITLPPGDPLAGNGRWKEWVSLVDVLPTLVELCGLESPEGSGAMEGRSLLPILRGQAPEPWPVFAESGKANYPEEVKRRVRFDVAGRFRTVLLGNWKLIWTPGQSPELEYELFDLAADPGETHNLYRDDHPEGTKLRRLLRQWIRALDDRTAEPDAEDLKMLEALGYIG